MCNVDFAGENCNFSNTNLNNLIRKSCSAGDWCLRIVDTHASDKRTHISNPVRFCAELLSGLH